MLYYSAGLSLSQQTQHKYHNCLFWQNRIVVCKTQLLPGPTLSTLVFVYKAGSQSLVEAVVTLTPPLSHRERGKDMGKFFLSIKHISPVAFFLIEEG